MLFYQGGCINCGNPRFTEEELKEARDSGKGLSGDRNVYIANSEVPEIVLGLCPVCFLKEDNEFDLAEIKSKMLLSEREAIDFKIEKMNAHYDSLEKAEFRSLRKRKSGKE